MYRLFHDLACVIVIKADSVVYNGRILSESTNIKETVRCVLTIEKCHTKILRLSYDANLVDPEVVCQ